MDTVKTNRSVCVSCRHARHGAQQFGLRFTHPASMDRTPLPPARGRATGLQGGGANEPRPHRDASGATPPSPTSARCDSHQSPSRIFAPATPGTTNRLKHSPPAHRYLPPVFSSRAQTWHASTRFTSPPSLSEHKTRRKPHHTSPSCRTHPPSVTLQACSPDCF